MYGNLSESDQVMQNWRVRNKARLQMATFAVEVIGAFALFWALNSGQNTAAAVVFAVLALGMGAIIWLD